MGNGEQGSLAAPMIDGSLGRTRGARPTESTGLLSWQGAAVALVLIIWLIPIKSYKLPVTLPFNLEIYRLCIVVLLFAWVIAAVGGSARLDAAGQGKPIALLTVAAVVALLANRDVISAAGLETQAVKSLSFFLSYLIVFLLLTSTLWHVAELEKVMRALVLGGAVVAMFAIVEDRTNYNAFQHLHSVLPFLEHFGKERTNFAGGQLRVRASAQHPIALGVALGLCIPPSIYLANRATTKLRASAWLLAASVITIGAMATKSRTVVLMVIAMLLVVLWIQGRKLLRRWPILIVLFVLAHFAAPGSVTHLYRRFEPKSGLVGQLQSRAGQRGSGRLADLGPGLSRWSGAPLFGRGLGTVAATGDTKILNGEATSAGVPIIFDDQYMNTLVSLGALGLIGVVWLVWGSTVKLGRSARRLPGGSRRDLLTACTASCAGFGAAMLTYDAFSFVQSTLVFLIIAAVGLRARSLFEP